MKTNLKKASSKKIKLFLLLTILAVGFSLNSCGQKKETSNETEAKTEDAATENIELKDWEYLGNKTIISDSVDFKALIDKGATILDVRTKEEYERGHVTNSVNIPLDELNDNLAKLKKNETIITICQSGRRSEKAAEALRKEGFTKVHNGGSWFSIISLGLGLDSDTSKKDKTKNVKEKKEGEVIHLTKEEFLTQVANFEKNPTKWQYLGNKPAIIDFYAPWCGPCKAIAPILDQLAKEYEGQIDIYKVNTEEEPELTVAVGVRNIPTFLFIPGGDNPKIAEGAVPEKQLREVIETLLLKK